MLTSTSRKTEVLAQKQGIEVKTFAWLKLNKHTTQFALVPICIGWPEVLTGDALHDVIKTLREYNIDFTLLLDQKDAESGKDWRDVNKKNLKGLNKNISTTNSFRARNEWTDAKAAFDAFINDTSNSEDKKNFEDAVITDINRFRKNHTEIEEAICREHIINAALDVLSCAQKTHGTDSHFTIIVYPNEFSKTMEYILSIAKKLGYVVDNLIRVKINKKDLKSQDVLLPNQQSNDSITSTDRKAIQFFALTYEERQKNQITSNILSVPQSNLDDPTYFGKALASFYREVTNAPSPVAETPRPKKAWQNPQSPYNSNVVMFTAPQKPAPHSSDLVISKAGAPRMTRSVDGDGS